jgi:hypothetical protein
VSMESPTTGLPLDQPLQRDGLGVDQLLMKDTYLSGDYEGTLSDKVTVKAVVEGEILEAERTVIDILRNPSGLITDRA